MNRQFIRAPYTAPVAEAIDLPQPLNLLVSISASASIEDWEDEGEEL